ncbi:Uma2 family endonuclease [Aquibacillus sp. 3ASR75-11]|uniref:Uma2 family endonuclease n=1 Tax=Terrihalobacillus insolitus TaxID=2950438 RepID=A0A9X3WUW5_9BACI|nr:Uma2 family endonuclease [Terrihalobacillus insolitus]MDC3414541.1 Uma2 family endonuclease [Terrihalobacillus insolitus]MDC3426125.1 Uma2 family endonuclease [Terrihalobacillus insolitus]
MGLADETKAFNYYEYLRLDEDVRYEVIAGKIYNMSPSPSPKHQDVVTQLSVDFGLYLRGENCRVFVSPIDVCLSDEREDLNKVEEWVQPDLVVVCDSNKINEKRIIGSPDLVVEVLSPSTAKKDRMVKYNRYQTAGIKEYWIVDPVHETVEVYLLNEDRYKHEATYFKDNTLPVWTFADLSIDLSNVFRSQD